LCGNYTKSFLTVIMFLF